jgi:hypothetical protein
MKLINRQLLHPVASSLLGPNILLRTLIPDALVLSSSLNVSDNYSFEKRGSVTSLCIYRK